MDRPPRRRPNANVQRPVPPPKKSPVPADDGFFASMKELFSADTLRMGKATVAYKTKSLVRGFSMHVFYSRERILCGVIAAVIMVLLALLQTTVFSTMRPFGAIPDIMISFVLALSVTEGEKWGAVWGIVAAVVIEALGVPDVTLLPLLYMPIGYFCGVLCKYYFTGSAAVRAVMTLSILPFRGIFTAIYMVISPVYATPGEIFFDVVLPEAGATLLLAIPVHLLLYLCLRPFHKTRAEMVSEK